MPPPSGAGCVVARLPSVASAADIRAVGARQQVQVAFDVDDAELVADELRAADAPLREHVLLPDRRAVAAVERLHGALVVDDVDAIARRR